LLTNRRGSQVHNPRCTRKAAGVCDGNQSLKLANIHRVKLSNALLKHKTKSLSKGNLAL
jgi:hypothetical protein